MIQYATALRLGTAESESILRRFTRTNVQHPTYRALIELGKAIKTTFLARYLHEASLRREVNDGLNVVENWNSASRRLQSPLPLGVYARQSVRDL
jgi:TnpA family transposase